MKLVVTVLLRVTIYQLHMVFEKSTSDLRVDSLPMTERLNNNKKKWITWLCSIEVACWFFYLASFVSIHLLILPHLFFPPAPLYTHLLFQKYYIVYTLWIPSESPGLHLCTSWFLCISSVQFSCSVVSDSLQPHRLKHTRLPAHHQLPELAQTHVPQVSDAIQPSHPLSSPYPPAFNLS